MWTNSSTSAQCSSQATTAPRRLGAGLVLPVPHSLACNPVFDRGVKHWCVQRQDLPGSSALDFDLRFRDVACTSSRQKDVEGLLQ